MQPEANAVPCLAWMHASMSSMLPCACVKGGNRRVLRDQVRQAFKKNKDETDPEKIEEQKQA